MKKNLQKGIGGLHSEQSALNKEIKEIENFFIRYDDGLSSGGYTVGSQAITNVLLWRLNKKIDRILNAIEKKK